MRLQPAESDMVKVREGAQRVSSSATEVGPRLHRLIDTQGTMWGFGAQQQPQHAASAQPAAPQLPPHPPLLLLLVNLGHSSRSSRKSCPSSATASRWKVGCLRASPSLTTFSCATVRRSLLSPLFLSLLAHPLSRNKQPSHRKSSPSTATAHRESAHPSSKTSSSACRSRT